MQCQCTIKTKGARQGQQCSYAAKLNGYCMRHQNCTLPISTSALASAAASVLASTPPSAPPLASASALALPLAPPSASAAALIQSPIVPIKSNFKFRAVIPVVPSVPKKGRVFIQSKIPPRQSRIKYPGDECPSSIKVDVTSGQSTSNQDRIAFSPMTHPPGGYRGFYCFENFWQSGKRYEHLGHLTPSIKMEDIAKWKLYDKPHRRHPKAESHAPRDAIYPDIGITSGIGYIESRKSVYAPYYHHDILMTMGKDRIDELKSLLAQGHDILVVDYDGPKEDSDGSDPGVIYTRPCLEVTVDLLRDKINDPRYQFGHGYLVAAALLDISLEEIF